MAEPPEPLSEKSDAIKRPDVSARRSQRKNLAEQCVKCALSGRLAPAWDPDLKAILQDQIEGQVLRTSEIIVRGSLLVNEVLLHCLRLGRPLPPLNQSFFNTCFLQGLKKESARGSKSDFSIVQDIFENEFHDYPRIQRNRGDCQAITIRKTSIRTSSARLAYQYRQVLVRNYDKLWQHRTERKRAKIALAVYAGKQRVLDGFFANLKASVNDGRPVVVAYGGATFHPTGKGEVSVPVKRVLQVCRRHCRTQLVNEYLTTKVHHACHQRLNPVSRVSEKRYPIRGLCWCQTCSKFVSRDGNAARNILRVYRSMAIGASRPHDLRFGQPKQVMQVVANVGG